MPSTWQDYIFSVGSLIFILALLPVLKTAEKPPVKTSLQTGGVLLIYSTICYTTMHLWYSFATTLLLAVMWLVIGFQRWRET